MSQGRVVAVHLRVVKAVPPLYRAVLRRGLQGKREPRQSRIKRSSVLCRAQLPEPQLNIEFCSPAGSPCHMILPSFP